MEFSFIDALPPGVRNACKGQIEQLQSLMDQLQLAAAAETNQQPPGPVITVLPDGDVEEFPSFGAAPSHNDAARVGPYKGAEKRKILLIDL